MRRWLLPAPALFFMAWGGNHFTPLLHVYESVGGYAVWQANLLLGMYVGGLVPGLLLAAALSDRHGRKPVLIAGALAALAASVVLAAGSADFVLLCAGRVLAGAGVGVAMSVGTSFVKELSSPPFEHGAGPTAGARRPSLTLTIGFGLGAGVTGALAQWAPLPTVLPFVLHAVLMAAAIAPLLLAPESLGADRRSTTSLLRDLRVPSAGHRRFTRLVAPMAPWVFAAAGVAYAILPATVQDRLGDWTTLYATVLTVLTLGTGAITQQRVPWLDRVTGGRAPVVGLAMMSIGMVLAVVAAVVREPWLVLLVAVLLGAAYGVCIVAGLIQVQSIAGPRDLAGLTGVYYSLTYTGFLLPTVLAALLPLLAYSGSLAIVAALCLLSLLLVARELRRSS